MNFSGSGRYERAGDPPVSAALAAAGREGAGMGLAEEALAGRKVLEAAVGAGAPPREEAEAAVAVRGGCLNHLSCPLDQPL